MGNASSDPASSTLDVASLDRTVATIAEDFIHRLAPAFRPPAHLVCPTDEAELSVIEAVARAATGRGISTEVINLHLAPAECLAAVTARLDGWRSVALDGLPGTVPTLLILRGFDLFGDEAHDAPTYPFRAKFQFDRKFLWLFIGRDWRRMWWLFGSHSRPLYQAAADITPTFWRTEQGAQHAR